jgi:small conductance mechanosensitive channel
VIAAPKQRIKRIPNVTEKPEPDVVIASFTAAGPAGPVLAIRPHTNNDYYSQFYFGTNLAIREVLGAGAFSDPMPVLGFSRSRRRLRGLSYSYSYS